MVNRTESPWGVRWTSLAMLGAILVVVTLVRRRPMLAVACAMGWLVSFEILFEATDMVVHHKWVQQYGWGLWLLAVSGWPFYAWLKGIRPHLGWTLVSLAVFAIWVEQGFWYNWAGQSGPVQWWYELLNVVSKTGLGLAFLQGALTSNCTPDAGRQGDVIKTSLTKRGLVGLARLRPPVVFRARG